MRKIAISLSKGGCAKTTTAVHLAHGLAMQGSRVLLVDTDTQGQCASFLGVKPEAGLAELVAGSVKPEEAAFQARENLWLLAGGRGLAGVKIQIARQELGGEKTLLEALEPLDGHYDYLLLDTAPGWDSLTIAALFCAKEVLAPVSLEVASVLGLLEFKKSLEAVEKYHKRLSLKYVLPTFMDGRVKKSEEILSQLKAHFGELLCDPIHYSVRLSEAPGYGQTAFEYAPDSPGAEDYQKLTRRIKKDARQKAYTGHNE
jgi:chromosome partitioning protein